MFESIAVAVKSDAHAISFIAHAISFDEVAVSFGEVAARFVRVSVRSESDVILRYWQGKFVVFASFLLQSVHYGHLPPLLVNDNAKVYQIII